MSIRLTHQEHVFAPFLRTIGRGPTLSRPLTRDEAKAAMTMVLKGDVKPVQLGAFLLLLRHRGETPDELAGMVDAVRGFAAIEHDPHGDIVDLDWPSYADRHRQQPWFVLAALLLAANGVRVLMHGISGFADGYAPTRPVLEQFGIPPASSVRAAAANIAEHNFAYLALESYCPPLERLFGLRPLLGVRTVVNTFARALNPLNAPSQMQGVFHPPYRSLHQQAALLLGQPRVAVFKGGGGEAQRNPLKPCQVAWVLDGITSDEDWPASLPEESYAWREEPLEPERVAALWRGDIRVPAPEAAVVGTAAIALKAVGRVATIAEAETLAARLWENRHRNRFTAPQARRA
jgi:anthranilate phosphoribosyltransferase